MIPRRETARHTCRCAMGWALLVALLPSIAAQTVEASPRPHPANANSTAPRAAGKRPNILVIWGDDVGVPQHQCV